MKIFIALFPSLGLSPFKSIFEVIYAAINPTQI
nr:MAG TPA: hypothetical protein [Caudoviricetes sp.]